MSDFIIKELVTGDINKELLNIGFDAGYSNIAAEKFRYKNIKIFDLTPAQANIIKQTAISVGADCGTHRDVITGGIEKSNIILGGSYSQLNKICVKLKEQPFKLSLLADRITVLLNQKQKKTKIVGVLNITDNSFSDGGKYLEPVAAQKRLIELAEEGADIVDIGAESTKPYSEPVDAQIQIERLKPILEFVQNENIKIPVSIDTRSSIVAEFVLNMGASIINDVSGFDFDKKMADVVSKYDCSVIIQHSKGTPETMQNHPHYYDTVEEIFMSLRYKIDLANSYGIKNIIIDPGIGFGKTKEDNFELINRAEEFFSLGCPLMYGISRKSLLGINDNDNQLKDSLSAAISYPLIKKGVDYLRVHNVKLHKKLLELV